METEFAIKIRCRDASGADFYAFTLHAEPEAGMWRAYVIGVRRGTGADLPVLDPEASIAVVAPGYHNAIDKLVSSLPHARKLALSDARSNRGACPLLP